MKKDLLKGSSVLQPRKTSIKSAQEDKRIDKPPNKQYEASEVNFEFIFLRLFRLKLKTINTNVIIVLVLCFLFGIAILFFISKLSIPNPFHK